MQSNATTTGGYKLHIISDSTFLKLELNAKNYIIHTVTFDSSEFKADWMASEPKDECYYGDNHEHYLKDKEERQIKRAKLEREIRDELRLTDHCIITNVGAEFFTVLEISCEDDDDGTDE